LAERYVINFFNSAPPLDFKINEEQQSRKILYERRWEK